MYSVFLDGSNADCCWIIETIATSGVFSAPDVSILSSGGVSNDTIFLVGVYLSNFYFLSDMLYFSAWFNCVCGRRFRKQAT